MINKRYCSYSVILLLLTVLSSQTTNKTQLIWPLPQSFQSSVSKQEFFISPCEVNFIIQSPFNAYIQTIIEHYQTKVFKCNGKEVKSVTMNLATFDSKVIVPTQVKHEAYSLTLRNSTRWQLRSDYYPGFVRGFQTFSQLFEINKSGKYYIKSLPIFIDDEPDFKWRGLLIDTANHFLSMDVIKKTIDVLLYAKMNILHWHIVDDDSFPMVVESRPQLSQYGSLSGTYSPSQIEEIINYAMVRGVRVVPEVDTPAHTQSWGLSQKYKSITMLCEQNFGQFDPIIPLTWQVMTDVLKYIDEKFPDDYVHFGGEELFYDCWEEKENIKKYLIEHNMTSFDLAVEFRQKQKKLWREDISKEKKVIYWANEDVDIEMQDDDVIQWWGISDNVNRLKGRKNEVILSNYDLTYLDKGFGQYDGFFADFYYQHWRLMYNFEPRIDTVNVIGGQVCMWDEVGNQYTHQQKVVLRSNILGERLWNHKIDIKTDLANIALRLSKHAARLRLRGLKVSPVTVQLCESKDMSICFP